MPVPSDVEITHNGNYITNEVLYSSAHFSAQASAGVGTFSLQVKDVNRTLSFVTGDTIELFLDGKKYFAGYIMQNGRVFAFPVVNTTTLANVTARQFALRGTNYNVLFDRLIVRNTANYLISMPTYPAGTMAGAAVRNLALNYLDIPSGFDVTTHVDDVGLIDPQGASLIANQGDTWRKSLETVSMKNGAIYYIDADKKLHFTSPESLFSPWGFSDRPNNLSVSLADTNFTGATYGFREMDTTEDISAMINDVFVWGGSEWAGPSGGTVFARSTNPTSITQHGRFQHAEIHFGEEKGGLGVQSGVTALAEAIVVGPGDPYVTPGTSGGITHNQSTPEWHIKLSWFAHDVPSDGVVKIHLTPGDIVTIILYVHGSGATRPLVLTLPLRSIDISFPTLPSNTAGQRKTYVRFDGTFSLSLTDPFELWQAILRQRTAISRVITTTASPTTTTVVPGAMWQGAPAEACNGTRTTFTLTTNSTPVRYSAGTSEVYLNGLRLRQGADYQEYPALGQITLFQAPTIGSTLWAYVRLVS